MTFLVYTFEDFVNIRNGNAATRSRDVSRVGRLRRHAARGDRSEPLGAVHVRVWARDEDCDVGSSLVERKDVQHFSTLAAMFFNPLHDRVDDRHDAFVRVA